MSEQTSAIVSKVWGMCNPLRDDGVSYGDYLEQLTYLIFLKMSDEYSKPPYKKETGIPAGSAPKPRRDEPSSRLPAASRDWDTKRRHIPGLYHGSSVVRPSHSSGWPGCTDAPDKAAVLFV